MFGSLLLDERLNALNIGGIGIVMTTTFAYVFYQYQREKKLQDEIRKRLSSDHDQSMSEDVQINGFVQSSSSSEVPDKAAGSSSTVYECSSTDSLGENLTPSSSDVLEKVVDR